MITANQIAARRDVIPSPTVAGVRWHDAAPSRRCHRRQPESQLGQGFPHPALLTCAMGRGLRSPVLVAARAIPPRKPGATSSVWVRDRYQHRHHARNRLSVRILFITSSAATL